MHRQKNVYSILFFIDMFVLLRVNKFKVLRLIILVCVESKFFAVDNGRCLVRFFIDFIEVSVNIMGQREPLYECFAQEHGTMTPAMLKPRPLQLAPNALYLH